MLTCNTGAVTIYFSRKARGDMSYVSEVARCCSMDSMEWRGCWRVILRYFCRGRLRLGKMACAASYGDSACFRPEKKVMCK